MHAEHYSDHVLEYIEISCKRMLNSFRSSGMQTRRRPIITNVAISTEIGLCRAYLLCILEGWFNCCPEKFIHLAPCFTRSIYAALPNLSEVLIRRRTAQHPSTSCQFHPTSRLGLLIKMVSRNLPPAKSNSLNQAKRKSLSRYMQSH